MSNQGRAQEFQIKEATIFADRFEEEYNITNYIGELSFFEDIERPYVTAQIVCMDDIGVFDEIKFKGTEQIRIEIRSVEDDLGDFGFTIVLNLVSIIQKNKVGDRSEVYHLNCISPHAYRDAMVKVSRSYTGNPDSIAKAVLKNHLDVDTDVSYLGSGDVSSSPMKVLIPYLSPLECAEWLLNRSSSISGSPVFFWQTIYDQKEGVDKVRIGTLDKMMNAPAFNEDKHLTYSAASAQSVANKGLADQAVSVKSIRIENIQDTLKLMHQGAVGSNFQSIDTYTSDLFDRHYSIEESIGRLETMRIVPYNAEQNIHDEEAEMTFAGETRKLSEWDGRYFNTVTSYGTYGAVNSYHDALDQIEALNKVRVPAVKSMFFKNAIDITIPGISFFAQLGNGNSGVSVGDTVHIDFLNSNVDEDLESAYNEDLSGKYLILRCRNIYTATKHEIVATISKLATRVSDA
jgi:hypothetical protein